MTSPSQRRRGGGQQRKRRRTALIRKQQGLCHWCKGYMREDVDQNHPLRATLDNLIPLSRGGTNTSANQVAACRACNIERRIAQGLLPGKEKA
jgi:5-methylcytosine-specific restriction endonuclease McrA